MLHAFALALCLFELTLRDLRLRIRRARAECCTTCVERDHHLAFFDDLTALDECLHDFAWRIRGDVRFLIASERAGERAVVGHHLLGDRCSLHVNRRSRLGGAG